MSKCNCQPVNYPFSCQRTNCSLSCNRPESFNSVEELEKFRETKCEEGESLPINRPGFAKLAWNFATALIDFVEDGCRTLTADQYGARIAICETCDKRSGNSCTVCGCKISLKARGRAFTCPLNKWPQIKES